MNPAFESEVIYSTFVKAEYISYLGFYMEDVSLVYLCDTHTQFGFMDIYFVLDYNPILLIYFGSQMFPF